jgi:hypothetical protein
MPEILIQGTWNDDFPHAHERMKVAVESLVGTDNMVYRLGSALHTMFHFLGEDEFPEELKEEYRDIIAECSTASHGDNESAFDATIRNMSPEKMQEIAERIVDLYDSIATDYWLPESLWPKR